MSRKVLFYKGKLYFSADTVYVPTKLSQLQNDVGYVTTDNKVYQDGGYISNDYLGVLLSGGTDDTDYTGFTRKNAALTFNPYNKNFRLTDSSKYEINMSTNGSSMISLYRADDGLFASTNKRYLYVRHDDIWLSGSDDVAVADRTWDGTYISLKTALSHKLCKDGDTMTGGLTCSTSGSNFKWGNITIYGGGSNGGINSVLIGDDVTLGDCNAGGMMGMKSTGTNAGIRLYDSSGNLIGGFQSTNGTPQWCNSSGTLTTISLNGHTHSYLPLSGGTLTGSMNAKFSNIDASKTNNNVSSTQYPTTFSILDTSNRILTRAEGIVESNGNISAQLYVRNYDTSGISVAQKGIKMTMNKSGALTWSIDDRLQFLKTLTNQNVGTSSQYVLTITDSWGKGGYCSVADFKTVLGLGSRAYDSTSYYPLAGGQLNGSMVFKATNLNKDSSNIQTWSNKEINWFDTNSKRLGGLNVRQYSGSTRYFGFEWWCEDGNGNWNSLRLINYVSESKYSVTSPINFRAAIGAAASSSRLYKTNIQDMDENEAKKILDISVKSFDYKEGFVHECDKKDKYYGIIAEEAIEKLPYVVNVPKDYDETKFNEKEGMLQKILTVDYANFVPYLIKMVQIQQREIDELREICANCTKNN